MKAKLSSRLHLAGWLTGCGAVLSARLTPGSRAASARDGSVDGRVVARCSLKTTERKRKTRLTCFYQSRAGPASSRLSNRVRVPEIYILGPCRLRRLLLSHPNGCLCLSLNQLHNSLHSLPTLLFNSLSL